MGAKLEVVNPPELGRPSGYSNGILSGGGRLLFIAGQVAWDAEKRIVGTTFAEQFGKALDNVLSVVKAAGGTPESITNLTIFVTDKKAYLSSLKNVGAAYRERMGRHYPAMALVQVAGLVEEGALLEIQGIAVVKVTAFTRRGTKFPGIVKVTPFTRRGTKFPGIIGPVKPSHNPKSPIQNPKSAFRNPAVTVDGIVPQKGGIVMVRRGHEPFKGMMALPGGFVEYGERAEEAVVREVREETGLRAKVVRLVGAYSDPKRDPRGHSVGLAYIMKPVGGELIAGDDAAEAVVVPRVRLLRTPLAFDHGQIVRDALKHLRV